MGLIGMNNYEVVTSRKVADLQDRVNQLMERGLRPVGGIAMLHDEDTDGKPHLVFAQAMIGQ
jgi:hypothetical protein